MRTLRSIILVLAALTGAPDVLGAVEPWRLDPATSRIALTFTQGGRPVEAHFVRFTSDIRFDPADLGGSTIEVTVDIASFTSGDAARDGQALGTAWLDAARQSNAVYRTLALRAKGGDRYEIDAELVLRGVATRLTHEAAIAIEGERGQASGTVPLLRTAFGIGSSADPNGQAVGLEVAVRFDFSATRVGG